MMGRQATGREQLFYAFSIEDRADTRPPDRN